MWVVHACPFSAAVLLELLHTIKTLSRSVDCASAANSLAFITSLSKVIVASTRSNGHLTSPAGAEVHPSRMEATDAREREQVDVFLPSQFCHCALVFHDSLSYAVGGTASAEAFLDTLRDHMSVFTLNRCRSEVYQRVRSWSVTLAAKL